MTTTKAANVAAVAVALSLSAAGVQAQGKWPERPIRLLTAFAPGGGSDILARALGQPVSEALGQTIVVDNRPGGGGTLGAGMAVNATPDGYTFILVSGSYGANAALHDLPYDSVTGITPIILVGETGLIVTMNPTKNPIKSIKDLIAFARANPGKLNFGSAGGGRTGTPVAGAPPAHDESEHHPRAVQGQRSRHERAARRRSALELQQPGAEHPAHQGG